ncbi:DUF1638 domain-containing protein [Jannaschia sp. M317]|uniref:DUF1638 domain-containing protein n=1 Tax=Jannaschia sp. M317 TaxID=2867011 RepID=UPI0021A4A605|nr:DUF1638 domain-containing protein [Jannaschia sp. M317]UWQ16338.1 DUF1638 domain-containing protein [Jannaschia sp. M317]
MIPDDTTLTQDGLTAKGTGRVLVVACGALAREVLAIRDMNGMDHLDLHCLPAILHNHPDRIAPAVEAALDERAGAYARAFVAYADCGTGGALSEVCARLGVEMIAGPHCYAFFDGLDRFAARDEIDAFYLTDFLARQFDAFVVRPLGLDRHPELRDMYFGNYRKLVYLAQTDDPDLTARAEAAATALGLSFERRATGYGELLPEIQRL